MGNGDVPCENSSAQFMRCFYFPALVRKHRACSWVGDSHLAGRAAAGGIS